MWFISPNFEKLRRNLRKGYFKGIYWILTGLWVGILYEFCVVLLRYFIYNSQRVSTACKCFTRCRLWLKLLWTQRASSGPTHKRTEGRAPCGALSLLQKDAALQGGFSWNRCRLNVKLRLLTDWLTGGAYLPAVSNTGTVFESWQIGQSCTNLRPPPWTTLGRTPRLRWGIIMPPNLSNLFDSSATIIISI